MARVLVIGYGNPLRTDDGAGWRVAEELEKRCGSDPEVEVIRAHQLLPEFTENTSRAGRLWLVDACADGTPADIRETVIYPCPATPRVMMHAFGPEELLSCAEQWFGRRPETTLYTIAGQSFAHGDRLTAAVEAACRRLVGRFANMIRHDIDAEACHA